MQNGLAKTNWRKITLLVGDITILVFSLWLTLVIRYFKLIDYQTWQNHLIPFLAVFFIFLITLYIQEFYELGANKNKVDVLNRLIQSVILSSFFSIAFFYIGSNFLFNIKPQRIFFIYVFIATALLYLWRIWFDRLAGSPKILEGLLLVGFNKLTEEVTREIQDKPVLGFKLKAIIIANEEVNNIPDRLRSLIISEPLDQLKEVCKTHGIQTIVTTTSPRDDTNLLKGLFDCLPLKLSFFEITNVYEKITGKIPVTTIAQIWFLENLTERSKRVYDGIKRIIDIILSIILIIIFLPFIPLIMLAVKLDSPGPVFFKQERCGKGGKVFTAIKFRTMVNNAENNGPQWAAKEDPRITRLGKYLRKTRIDEIPQLINVLKNEMSLIGPRPERPEFIEQLQNKIPFYKERLLVKPGLTGWAQVKGPSYGGSFEETLEKIQYDLYYIKNRSLALDLSVILKTIRTILNRQGQ